MIKQKQGMKIGRGQIYLLTIKLNRKAIIPSQLFQDCLQFWSRFPVVNVYEVVMVLHHKLSPVEDGVMMMRIVNFNTSFFCQERIRLFLLSELPNINITTRSMLWLWPIQRTGIAFQHHHLVAMLVVEPCHFCHSLTIQVIAILKAL